MKRWEVLIFTAILNFFNFKMFLWSFIGQSPCSYISILSTEMELLVYACEQSFSTLGA